MKLSDWEESRKRVLLLCHSHNTRKHMTEKWDTLTFLINTGWSWMSEGNWGLKCTASVMQIHQSYVQFIKRRQSCFCRLLICDQRKISSSSTIGASSTSRGGSELLWSFVTADGPCSWNMENKFITTTTWKALMLYHLSKFWRCIESIGIAAVV